MKTAKEWIKQWGISMGGPSRSGYVSVCVRDIEDVQQEAFLEGQLKGLQDAKEATMKVIDEVFSKSA